MALEDLNPAVRVEEILDGADIEPATRLEYFMKKAANEVPKPAGSSDAGKVPTVNEDGDGYELGAIPSCLPSYTSADKGKFLGLGEASSVDIVPEQALVISGSPTDATSIDNANTEYFVNGATIHVLIKVGNSTDVDADVTVTQIGSSIETGDIYGKLNRYQFYIESGVLKFWCDYAGTYTVHVTVFNASVTPVWENVGRVVTITIPNELNTLLMSTLQSRAPAAISAGVGNLVYTQGSYTAASDTDALSAFISTIIEAMDSNAVIRLLGGPVVTGYSKGSGDTYVEIDFAYPMYVYSTYSFRLDLRISAAFTQGYRVDSTITLLH